MRVREVERALRKAGCTFLRSDGRHAVYGCPCGRHVAPVPTTHLEVTAGTIRSIIKQLACLENGWLR
ncbi:MAG: type II toxin-antitoxin system HicA family toxin [Candidatus Nanopelagicales bacterium]